MYGEISRRGKLLTNIGSGRDIVVTIVFPPTPQLSFWKKWEENSFLNKAGSERVELDNPSDDMWQLIPQGRWGCLELGKGVLNELTKHEADLSSVIYDVCVSFSLSLCGYFCSL